MTETFFILSWWKFQVWLRKWFFKKALKLARAPMPDPAHDELEPFSYFRHPNTQLAIPGENRATQVTPEGNLWTGFAEFFTTVGTPPKPVEWRHRTFRKGWIPVIEASHVNDGIRYEIEMFMEQVESGETGPANFVKMTARNETAEPREAAAGMGIVYPNKSHRCFWKWFVKEKFSKQWKFEMDNKAAYRDGKLMYVSIGDDFSQRWQRFDRFYTGEFGEVLRGEKCCIGVIEWWLEPGESKSNCFVIPCRPVEQRSSEIAILTNMNYIGHLEKTIGRWKKLVGAGAELVMPERKVAETSLASRVYNFQSRVKKGDQWVQLVNRLHYAHFWLRDAAFISRMWDVWGYHDVAEQTLLNFLNYARPDGLFASQKGQLDGWGQSLWAFGQHVRITADLNFAALVHPYISKAFEWIERTIQADPAGLLPPADALDNELLKGRYTGHNIWALAGLREAIYLAVELGESAEAAKRQQLHDSYKKTVLNRFLFETERNDGVLPPGLDVRGGEDWGNLLLLYVGELVDPFDPMVTRTFDHYRNHKYAEGLSTWNGFLHHYLTERVAQTALIRGEAERTLADFYSMTIHTGPTHEGFEWAIVPWDGRDYAVRIGPFELANFPPHGWFAANFNILLRNMIVMEGIGKDSDTLNIFSGLSPAWAQPGCSVGLRNAPTHFGNIDILLTAEEDGANIEIKSNWRKAPARISMRRPFFVETWSIKGDKTDLGTELIFPPDKTRFDISWNINPQKAALSYISELEKWKAEYRRRYDAEK